MNLVVQEVSVQENHGKQQGFGGPGTVGPESESPGTDGPRSVVNRDTLHVVPLQLLQVEVT